MSSLLAVLARLPRSEPVGALLGDEAALVDDASRHGLSAWVLEGLTSQGVTLGEAQPRLVAAARQQIAQAARMRRFLFTVLDALGAEGIVPVLLKGYGLASRLFGQPLVRPSVDVDLLVELSQLEHAARVIERLGLARLVDDSLDDPFEDHHHLAFRSAMGLVELHFHLTSGLGVEVDDGPVLARAREAMLEGRRVRYLRGEDEFVYLAAHAANHAFLRLSWLVDLQLFLRAVRLDWRLAEQCAAFLGCKCAVATALQLLERYLGVVEPEARARFRPGLGALPFTAGELSSARWAAQPVPNFLLRLWLVDGLSQAGRFLSGGVLRAVRRRARAWR